VARRKGISSGAGAALAVLRTQGTVSGGLSGPGVLDRLEEGTWIQRLPGIRCRVGSEITVKIGQWKRDKVDGVPGKA
jgi:hypothetical protein